MRFRLLECKRCQERHWTVDEETPPAEGYDLGMCAHEWLERFLFDDEGPHPTRIPAPEAVPTLPQSIFIDERGRPCE